MARFSMPFTSGDRPYTHKVFWSYLPDWIVTIFLWGVFYLIDKVNGYRRVFSVTDTSLAHPYAVHERIPVWLLAVICGIVPAVIIVIVAALSRSFWDAHNGILGLILALGLSVTFTDILKITAGRPRPDFLARCKLPMDQTENPVHGLTSWKSCTDTTLLKEGFRSFPSGHSSFAWTGMWFLALYLAAKFRVANRRGYTITSWLLLIPISCSSLVSISRTMDYRHHATDVIGGAVIGILTGWWGYRQYYPAIHAATSWKPYDPRIDPDDLPLHNRTTTSAESDHPLTSTGPTGIVPYPSATTGATPNYATGATPYDAQAYPPNRV